MPRALYNGTGNGTSLRTADASEEHMTRSAHADFQPVLLGTGANAYGLARGFFDEFGVTSLAVGSFPLTPTRHSRLVEVRTVDDFTSDRGFLRALEQVAAEQRAAHPDRPLLLIATGDTSAALLARNRDVLRQWYLTSTIDGDLLQRVVEKSSFYELCAEYGIDHPITSVYTHEQFEAGAPVEPPAAFPIALKASDSVAYLDCQFEGRRKAYVLESQAELNDVVERIYTAGYPGALILQDFIPGDDSNMRVLNAYVNSDGSVAMMSLGRPLMEEWAPDRVGNYAAIVSGGEPEIYAQAAHLLTALGYTGYVNLDVKRDPRDGSFKFFEINPRPGGSSYFTTVAGLNMARWIVLDLIEHRYAPTVLGERHCVWLGVPRSIVRRYAPEGALRDEALALIRRGEVGTTVFCRHDPSPRRTLDMLRYWLSFHRTYRRWAK